MGEDNTKNLMASIQEEFEGLQENHADFAEKGNKAAGTRARKHANNLKKLLTPYKKASVNESKQI